MNGLGHELAMAQVNFLERAVDSAQERVMETSQRLLDFQNKMGLTSPLATAESLQSIIANLEAKRTDIQTQLASLPVTLAQDHPAIAMLNKSLAAVEQQIGRERLALASPEGGRLNYAIEAHQRLEIEVTFAQDVYKTSLVALEKGRMDATRTLKKVSVLQAPLLPEYAIEPRRLYNGALSLTLALLLTVIFKLLASIVRDHVD